MKSNTISLFFYDGWNLVREVEVRGIITNVVEYVWGKDLSGTFQGAGGVGGLLYERRDGAIYIPYQDAFGNVMGYWDTNGVIVAEYTYDAFGRTISQSGSMADMFRHRFSTKYFDTETGFYYYGYRYYFPELRRWLNRDPLEEEGGNNLYVFCMNSSLCFFDDLGGKASPFKFVNDPRTRSGHFGSYLALWYPADQAGSLFYSVDISGAWGQCDDDGKCPDKSTSHSFSERQSFWENQQSRRKDENGKVNIYINVANTDPHGGIGFTGQLPDGSSGFDLQGFIDGNENGLNRYIERQRGTKATWGEVNVTINWRSLAESGPAHTSSLRTHGLLWHEYLEKNSYPYGHVPSGMKTLNSGNQSITIKWSCQDSQATVSSNPFIANGPDRWKTK